MTHTVETLSRAFVNDFHRKIFFKKKLLLFKTVNGLAEYIPRSPVKTEIFSHKLFNRANDNNVDFILRVKCDFASYNKSRNEKNSENILLY